MADIYQSVPASAGRIYTPLHPVARPRGQRASGLRPIDGVLAGVGLLAVAILPMLGWTSANLIDDRLGGRLKYLQKLEISFLGQDTINIPEVVYYGLLQSYGLVGLVIALAALSYGAFYGLVNWGHLSQMRRSAVLGVMAYLFACTMDGAFVFPPVFPLFLFVNALIYRRGYRVAQQLVPAAVTPRRPRRRSPARPDAQTLAASAP